MLVEQSYRLCRQLPKDEQFGLASQIKRAATSIPANISEGAARNSRKDYVRFLYIARGSLSELDTHFEVCDRLGVLSKDSISEAQRHLERTSFLLNKQINALTTTALK